MSILPTSVPPSPLILNGFRPHSHVHPPGSRFQIPLIFRKILRVKQMDFELASWQMIYLCVSPRRVYRNVYYHKRKLVDHAKSSAIAWSIMYSLTPFQAIRLCFVMVFRDFIGVGFIIATCIWLFAKAFLLPSHSQPGPNSHYAVSETRLEWAYAFDVHTNAFFPLYLSLYLLQIFMAPVITKDRWVCLWVGNTMYLAALTQYTYISYLGLNALPFLIRSELLLFPLLPIFASYVASLLGFNIAKWVLGAYFG